MEEFAHDPELEEASIRFANGDDAGAEAGLMEVLGPQGARIDHDETWLTLFDLYRATGQQDRFETRRHRLRRPLRPLGAAVVLDARSGRRACSRAGRGGMRAAAQAAELDLPRRLRHADRWRP